MLRHSNDSEPGYSRRKAGRNWHYFDTNGKRVTNAGEVERLNRIGLPPAYTDSWFCKDDNGHIQATGLDARGRKQYRYHADYRARQDSFKFDGTYDFGKALPRIRRRVEADLRRRKLDRDTVLAAVVRLLDQTAVRVGNEQYAKENQSFGATTLRNRHIRRKGRKVVMRFKGKSGKLHEHVITDRRLGNIVRQCQDLPGQALFQYLDEDGEPRAIDSGDVNAYIRAASGGEFTAKHFRTWAASAIAFEQLMDKDADARITLLEMLGPVAEALGNTPAISRKSYVHPALVDAVKDMPDAPLGNLAIPRTRKRLSRAETGLLAFLAPKKRKRRKSAKG